VSRIRIVLLLAALAAAVPVVPHALAQPAGDPGRALTLGHEAMGLYNKGNWTEARAKFEEAERLTHSPVFVLFLARCARNAGDLAAAKAAYERLVKEVIPAGAPAPWGAAVESARQELPELEKRIAEMKAAGAASTATTASAAAAPSTAPTTPPSAAPSGAPSGGVPSPTGVVSAPVPAATSAVTAATRPAGSTSVGPAPETPGARTQGSLAPGLAALGVGAAGIGIGIGLFAHAFSIASGIKEQCEGNVCPRAEVGNRDSAVSFADGATGAFVVGGAALAAGVVLLLVRPGGKPGAPAAAVSVQPGFASIRVSGAF
jgi:hypothetical protein